MCIQLENSFICNDDVLLHCLLLVLVIAEKYQGIGFDINQPSHKVGKGLDYTSVVA